MSIASVSGRLRAERKAAAAPKLAAPKWPELTDEDRAHMAKADEAVTRAKAGGR